MKSHKQIERQLNLKWGYLVLHLSYQFLPVIWLINIILLMRIIFYSSFSSKQLAMVL